ncbi:DUF397 domain-containing protein [Streptomyces sp. PTD5-9]|uniref:DUF397 domain-containing protein n=1 Tax=Streptomyces sp. PTD5-9 TaxID=3120150 RepID=UPI0030093A58
MSHHDWQRSSFCSGGGNNCVEVTATEGRAIAIRESESPRRIVTTNRAALRSLVLGMKTAEFSQAHSD